MKDAKNARVRSRSKVKHYVIGIVVGAVLVAAAAGAYHVSRLAPVGTAFVARMLCSGVFVSHREPSAVLSTDLAPEIHPILYVIDARADREAYTATASVFGLAERKAVYRDGFGCVVVDPGIEPATAAALAVRPTAESVQPGIADGLPVARELPPEIDAARLGSAVDWAFSEPNPKLPLNTRAVLVVYDGRIVAERYAPGFTADTALIGWSMTKSVVNALVGILVKEGNLSLDAPAPVREWDQVGDPRRRITVAQLLQMTSGLEFDENYADPLADVTTMLFGVPNAAEFAIAKPLQAQPGTRWQYSSGTTNVLSHAIRGIVGEVNYSAFPRHALFERIGMASAVMETDAHGTFIGSSFMYASARDWARFGLLYLQDGVWSGERILPEGWVDFSRSPAPGAPSSEFGAHFWLRVPHEFDCAEKTSDLPADAFHAVGYDGQLITIIPSRALVLVRLGLTHTPCAWDHPQFVQRVLSALEHQKKSR